MKSDKSPLKKTVGKITSSIKAGAAKMARSAKLKSAAKPAEAKAPEAKAVAKKAEPVAAEPPMQPAPKPRRKAAPKSELISVPPILLEGDKPPVPPSASGPGQRYSLGPVPPAGHAGQGGEPGELPEAYGTRQLMLVARDPHWLYARWDLTREQQKHYNSLSTDRHLVVRIYVDHVKGDPLSQVHVHPESTHWFIDVPHAGAKYVGELGYFQAGGRWVSIATSAATMTPPDSLSDDMTAQFATIPIDVPMAQLLELARAAVRQNIPLAEILLQLRAHGHHVAEAPTGEWTVEQERALASIISMDRVRRVWMGSLEITELIRRQLQQQISSLGVSSFSMASSPLGAFSSFSSVSSPFGVPGRRRGFWFNVNAELILYGATEPDAQVTIGGRVIQLRPDGTFSYRFALPDGQYQLPAIATAADKLESRSADLKFSRDTQYEGDVGAHPQDPKLRPPLVAHVA